MLHVSVSLALSGTIQLNLAKEIEMKVSLYPWKERRDVFMNPFSCYWFRMQKWQLRLQQPFWIMTWHKNSQNSWEGNLVIGCHHDVTIPALETYLFQVIEKSTSVFFKPQFLGFMSHTVEYNSAAAAAAKSLQSCPTLCNPPDSAVPGILQARTLEWVALAFSNTWKWKVKVKSFSRVWLFATPWTAAYQAPPSMRFSRQEY